MRRSVSRIFFGLRYTHMRRASLRVVALAAVAVAGFGCSAGGPSAVTYVVVPHPDDEVQAWSLIENTPGTYEVFIMLTKGEQSFYCDSPGYDEGTGEARPDPWPDGKWAPTCEAARMNSFFDFMAGMAAGDNSLSASFSYEGVKGPFAASGQEICRYDDGGCVADLTAEVWTSPEASVVWFNLGDGDVTAGEVTWAIETVLADRATFGVDSELGAGGLIGASYWNGEGHAGCSDYAHPDHGAVHEVLWHTDFGVGYQAAPVCASDPEVSVIETVTHDRFDDAFATSGATRVGEHVVHYGWLLDGSPGYYRGDYDGQDTDFHRHQHFWVRFE